jgi:hypothetical protein
LGYRSFETGAFDVADKKQKSINDFFRIRAGSMKKAGIKNGHRFG